jgi:hypothetical protein
MVSIYLLSSFLSFSIQANVICIYIRSWERPKKCCARQLHIAPGRGLPTPLLKSERFTNRLQRDIIGVVVLLSHIVSVETWGNKGRETDRQQLALAWACIFCSFSSVPCFGSEFFVGTSCANEHCILVVYSTDDTLRDSWTFANRQWEDTTKFS